MFNFADHEIQVRCYQDSDAKSLRQIYYDTIHNINSKDYTFQQLEAWAPASCLKFNQWSKKWNKTLPFVALLNKIIVGFVEFEATGYIDCFYVHHKFQNLGVGSSLMNKIEQAAFKKGLTRIYAEVSITAKPFFKMKGFKVVNQQIVKINNVDLINFVMEKKMLY